MLQGTTRAHIGVASSIEPRTHIPAALRALRAAGTIARLSRFYVTPAIGRPDDPPFANGVVALDTPHGPRPLKAILRAIEAQQGRIRGPDAWAPRTLDLDLLLHGNATIDEEDLRLPDPDLLRRPFLAWCLLEADPMARLPDGTRPPTPAKPPGPVLDVDLTGIDLGRGPTSKAEARVARAMPPSPGAPCPAFTATASVSGRTVTPDSLKGHKAVLVVHGVKSTQAPKEVAKAVRARSMDPKDPILATVVDLRSMAGLWRKVAEAQIKSTYNNLAQKLPEGQDPADHILICADWDGSACQALGVEQPDRAPVAIVLGKDGTVTHVIGAGPTMGQEVVQALG